MKQFVLTISFLLALAGATTAAEVKNAVYFSFGMTDLSAPAVDVVKAAAASIKSSGAKEVVLTGYCDAAEEKLAELSEARAKAISGELRKQGVPESTKITVSGKGANDLARPTKPGVREPLNRRVTVAY